MTLIATITDANDDRTAQVWQTATGFTVFFGYTERGTGDFRVAPYNSSREYKTRAGADRAARRWTK